MRVLVSGGAGFIGSHLVDLLLDHSHEVIVFDNFSTGRWENLTTAWGGEPVIPPPGVSMDHFHSRSPHRPLVVQPGTITWQPNISDVMRQQRPEVVFHLAAQVDVGTSVEHPVVDADVNVLGTVRMLEASAAAGVRRFVFVSTAAVFGDALGHRFARAVGAWEPRELPTAPISPYGASKASAELYVELYDRMPGALNTCTVTMSNVYGPRQRPDFGAVNRFARALLAGEPVTLHGDGGNVRDYLYVADAARALAEAGGCLPAVQGKRTLGAVGRWLVGTGIGTTDRDLFAMVRSAVNEYSGVDDVNYLARCTVTDGPARPANIRSSVFPAAPQATTPLAEGLRLTVEAIRKELGL